MDTVVYLTSILMWILCPAIIGLILLQGAAGDISSAFGGGGQLDASLGVGAHRKMAQVTGALAVLFFIMVLLMAYPHRGSFQDVKGAPVTKPAPVVAPMDKPADQVTTPVVAPETKPEAAKPEAAKPETAAAPVEEAKPNPAPEPAAAPAKP